MSRGWERKRGPPWWREPLGKMQGQAWPQGAAARHSFQNQIRRLMDRGEQDQHDLECQVKENLYFIPQPLGNY